MHSKIKAHWTLFLVLVGSVFLGFWQHLCMAYAIILVHELAHVLVGRIFGARLKCVTILPFGVSAEFSSASFTPRQDVFVSLAGPAVNLILTGFGLLLGYPFFTGVNAGLALVNLLPAFPLDGGRALRSFLAMRWGGLRARNFSLIITKITTVLIVAMGGFFLCVTKINFSLLIIGAFLVTNWIFEAKNHTFSQMRGLLNSMEKLNEGETKATHLVARDTLPARFVLKNFHQHRYCLVDVVRADSSLLATLTETEIVNGLAAQGIRSKLGELARMSYEHS